jgi:hypothetical protein
MRPIVKPEKFAAWFNRVMPSAHRQITVDDVRDMVTCGLIGKFDCFLNLDFETVKAVLQYEQLRQNRQKKDQIKDSEGIMHCRRCGVVLIAKPKSKWGRSREYCTDCEPSRATMWYRKWRRKTKAAIN